MAKLFSTLSMTTLLLTIILGGSANANTVDISGTLVGTVEATPDNSSQSISNGTGTDTGGLGALLSWSETGSPNVTPVNSDVPVTGTFEFEFADGGISGSYSGTGSNDGTTSSFGLTSFSNITLSGGLAGDTLLSLTFSGSAQDCDQCGDFTGTYSGTLSSTPLPSSLLLFAGGLGIVLLIARRRRLGCGFASAT